MTLPTPEDLGNAPVWENYIIVQATQASLGLIPQGALAFGVAVDGLHVTLTCQVREINDDGTEDLQEIAQELAVLLGEQATVTIEQKVHDTPTITPQDTVVWTFIARSEEASS
ncbi:hypothetical protein APR04_005589 [Promicromonospora umidemergens]|uniref:DUF3168 domain-containing protein n=1 Tax=Promicromonospora umidemergens TaxID=629679 RepID=A0ABP8YC00_9MICO|nr:hypothetical protein [Promicromonospora umidemergens]MCP2286649.1 hypothetical protein [Promicromonospora umidemergens]